MIFFPLGRTKKTKKSCPLCLPSSQNCTRIRTAHPTPLSNSLPTSLSLCCRLLHLLLPFIVASPLLYHTSALRRRYPTVDNDFYIDFIKITSDLDQNVDHVLMVCGHAKPDACVEAEEHVGADPSHPCGPSDAADPEMANKTGAFCEILNMTTTTEEGEVLIHGFEKLEFLEAAYEETVAAGETPQVPVIHLEVVEAEELMNILGLNTTEEMAMLADFDYELEDAEAPGPAPIITTTTVSEGDDDDDEETPEARRRLLRAGGHGGFRGGGLRRGGGMRNGRGVGNARRGGLGPGSHRNRGMEINQVLGNAYYGNKGHKNHGGQIAYYNNPGGIASTGK